MNCDGIKHCLSEGQPLSSSAQEHLESCAGCCSMVAALDEIEDVPDRRRLARIEALITSSLEPVHPLPPDGRLILISMVFFTAFSLLAAIPVGYNGFHALSLYQGLAYYGVITVCAVLFSAAIVQQMIPGSKRKVHPQWVIVIALLSLVGLAIMLFENFDLDQFVRLGKPCLRLGCICAVVSGALSWLVVRKGFLISPVKTRTTAGFFAGLAGVAVLALHCPIQNSAHIIVWHLGAMVVGGAGGAGFGILWRYLPIDRP